MRRRENGLLVIICAGMVLSWIYAWAAFIMAILGFPPFSITDGALILALAAGITWLHQGRGWRIASIIGLQAVGLSFAACRMIYIPSDWADPFWSGQWLAVFFTRQRTLVEWTAVVLSLIWTAALWIAGIRLVVKAPDRFAVSGRFDLGAAAFFTLLIVQLIMIGKGVPVNGDSTCQWSLLSFFMLGLLALGMGRDGNGVEKDYMAAYGGIGAVLSFMMLVLLFGGGLVTLFLPSLKSAAEVGHDLIRAAARPLIPVLITVLRFIFLSGCRTAQEGYRPSGKEGPGPDLPIVADGELGLFQSILTWGFIGLAGIIGLAVFVFGAYWLIRWLAARAPRDEKKASIWAVLLRLLGLFKTFLLSLPTVMMRKRAHVQAGAYPYDRLQRWGAHCGLGRIVNETPLEHGSRLARQFPTLESDIALIVELYNQTVYGLIQPDEKQIISARRCWHRIRRPRYWPARLRTWFLSPSRQYAAP
jgi:hypothetical protein